MSPGKIFVFMMTGLALFSCKQFQAPEEGTIETTLPEKVAEIQTMTLRASDFQHEILSNGKLMAGRSVDLSFKSGEVIAQIHVKNGDRVEAGQVLAELERFKLENNLTEARMKVEETHLIFQDKLFGMGYHNPLQDSATIPSNKMRIAVIQSGYENAIIARDMAEYELENSVLKAPFAGTVSGLFDKQYNIAKAGETFCTILDYNHLEVDFSILESELGLVNAGDQMSVAPFAFPEKKATGRVTEINPVVDENGMVQVRSEIPYRSDLYEGMNVKVSVVRSPGMKLVVPKSAVVLRTGRQVVFTLVDGKAFWNYVTTGLENATEYTIEEGLKPGDLVIVSGNINLAHESPVIVKE